VRHVESHPSVRSATLLVNDTRIDTVAREAPKTVIWPGTGRATVLQLSPAQGDSNNLGFTGSSWTFIPFLNAASSVNTQGDTTRATFIIGGRHITYDFTINALVNPFTMPELTEFECPTSLD
jgi:type VI secretion system protein ImpL